MENKILIKSIGLGMDKLFIELTSNNIMTIPYTYTKKLQNATFEELNDYRLIGNGIGIHFEKLDEDISINGILKDFDI
jgi:hypothetical protein